jgi:hypothetical protein
LRGGPQAERRIAFDDEEPHRSRALQLEDQTALELERIREQAHRAQRLPEKTREPRWVRMATDAVAIRRIEAHQRSAQRGALEYEARDAVGDRHVHRLTCP